MNSIEELKSKKPENLKSRSSVSADYVTDDNTGGYFVVECGNCGEVFPSQKLDGGGAIADSGDYGDAYCPHCNETDPDECANVGLVWNVQQAKINALIAQLEAAQKEIDTLKVWKKIAAGRYENLQEIKSQLEKAEAALSAANEKYGWIKCSEQMPDPNRQRRVCVFTPHHAADLRYRLVPANLFNAVCSSATHWHYVNDPVEGNADAE